MRSLGTLIHSSIRQRAPRSDMRKVSAVSVTATMKARRGLSRHLPTPKLEIIVNEYERWQSRFSQPGYAFGKGAKLFPKIMRATPAAIRPGTDTC